MNIFRNKPHFLLTPVVVLFFAATVAASPSPFFYSVFYAEDEATGELFTDGGSGALSISKDGGENFYDLDHFYFDGRGRAYVRVYWLNYAHEDWIVRIEASFDESGQGQPFDTVIESTVGEFQESLKRFHPWFWISYLTLPVSYEEELDIVDTAIAAGDFTKLVAAVQTAGLEDALRGDGPFTVFAPTDEAFGALGLSDEDLLALPDLAEILLYHVVPGALDGNAVAAEETLETLLEKDVAVTVEGESIFINEAQVVVANIEAANGIIHVIDSVLLPPELPTIAEAASSNEDFSTLVAALVETGLDEALSGEGPFTVFAPTNAAFEALLSDLGITAEELLAAENLADILLYHVVSGRLDAGEVVAVDSLTTLEGKDVDVSVTEAGVFINDSQVIVTDIKCENGIIHVIDSVLIPTELPDIVTTATEAGDFSTLVELLQATGLDEVLRGEGPFTVFAPTNAAFEALPDWLVNFLVNNPRTLEQVLLYHVVAEDLGAGEVLAERRIKTVQGRSVYVKTRGDDAYINSSKILATDIKASNGTIHVIDKILIPWFWFRF